MKFKDAWSNVIRDNQHLKIALAVMSVSSIVLSITSTSLALKKPIVIERGCYSKVSTLSDIKQTPLEYEEFLKLALKQRFNSDLEVSESFLSISEKRAKESEQKNLLKNGLNQRIIIREITFNKDHILVSMDRTFAVKNVRSTLPTKIKVELEKKSRNKLNPYGLILVKSTEIKEKKDKKK